MLKETLSAAALYHIENEETTFDGMHSMTQYSDNQLINKDKLP
jgi:hypothetical protein